MPKRCNFIAPLAHIQQFLIALSLHFYLIVIHSELPFFLTFRMVQARKLISILKAHNCISQTSNVILKIEFVH